MNRIVIVPYQAGWPAEFTAIGGQLRRWLGGQALRIDHIGSTAVPGLVAKDVIDIQISVASLADEDLTGQLLQRGFETPAYVVWDTLTGMADHSPDLAKSFLRAPTGQRAVHIHIRQAGRVNQRYPLLFRDFLRAHPPVRQAYAAVKQQLAARFADDKDAYYAIKDPHMDTIYQAALLWADAVGWQPDEQFL